MATQKTPNLSKPIVVEQYIKKDGTVVQQHTRVPPNTAPQKPVPTRRR